MSYYICCNVLCYVTLYYIVDICISFPQGQSGGRGHLRGAREARKCGAEARALRAAEKCSVV